MSRFRKSDAVDPTDDFELADPDDLDLDADVEVEPEFPVALAPTREYDVVGAVTDLVDPLVHAAGIAASRSPKVHSATKERAS